MTAQLQRLADEAIADASEWKRRTRALEKALAKANQHIEQLCSTVNTLSVSAGKGRKVRVEDFRVQERGE